MFHLQIFTSTIYLPTYCTGQQELFAPTSVRYGQIILLDIVSSKSTSASAAHSLISARSRFPLPVVLSLCKTTILRIVVDVDGAGH